MSLVMRTFVSPVLCPGGDAERHTRIQYGENPDGTPREVCWLDELLAGGIAIPDGVVGGEEPPLLWLVTGPPGTGKTQFCLQVCYNIATQGQKWSPDQIRDYPLGSYLGMSGQPMASDVRGASESDIEKMADLRDAARVGVLQALQESDALLGRALRSGQLPVIVEALQKRWESIGSEVRAAEDAAALDYAKAHALLPAPQHFLRSFYMSLERPAERVIESASNFGWDRTQMHKVDPGAAGEQRCRMWVMGSEFAASRCPDEPHEFVRQLTGWWEGVWGKGDQPAVVVIDSLNTLPKQLRSEVNLDRLRHGLQGKTMVVMVICDTDGERPEPWDYLADIITRLDHTKDNDYQLGTFTIIKAQNQEHALGPQRLKIYGNPTVQETGLASGRVRIDVERGGVYIYPSVHRLLGAGAMHLADGPSLPLPIGAMDPLLGHPPPTGQRVGLPSQRPAVFVGPRGTLKSYLAYRWLLQSVRHQPEVRGVLLSLRDDEGAATETLRNIATRESLGIDVDGLLDQGLLTIKAFRPGNLPPEEFMHEVIVRVVDSNVRCCVVNGIDHIPARLPLCASLSIFVPALATLLSRHGVTVLFTATEERPGGLTPLGLLPVADVVLRFSPGPDAVPAGVPSGAEQVVCVTGERVAGGGIGGRKGYLYRVPGDPLEFVPG